MTFRSLAFPLLLALAPAGALATVAPPAAPAAPTAPAAPAPAMPARAPANPDAAAVFRTLDADADGSVSRAEFDAGWQRLERIAEARGRLHAQFARVDANGDAGLDATEFGQLVLVRQAGKDAPPLATFDTDRDGRLQFSEYVALVGRLAPKPEARR